MQSPEKGHDKNNIVLALGIILFINKKIIIVKKMHPAQ